MKTLQTNSDLVAFASLQEMNKWANETWALVNNIECISKEDKKLLIEKIKFCSDKFIPTELVFQP